LPRPESQIDASPLIKPLQSLDIKKSPLWDFSGGGTIYFSSGCSEQPQRITGIEIDQELAVLVRWRVKPDQEGSLFIQREILAGPENIEDYFPDHGNNLKQTQEQLRVEEETAINLFSYG
jgi:hypothetical protein